MEFVALLTREYTTQKFETIIEMVRVRAEKNKLSAHVKDLNSDLQNKYKTEYKQGRYL